MRRTTQWLSALAAVALSVTTARAAEAVWPSFLWNDPGAAPALLELKKLFEAENPGNKINNIVVPISVFWDKQLADVSSGNPSDILTLYDPEVRAYIEHDVLEPLDDILVAGGIDRSQLVPSASLGMKNGKLLAIPLVVNARALFYNEKLFAAAAIQPPRNAEEFYAAAKSLTQPSAQQFGFATASKPGSANLMYIEMMPLVAGFGGGFFKDGKPTANSPATVAALSLYKRLYDENLIPRGAETGTYREMFAQGKIAMYASGAFMASVVAKANPQVYENLRAMPLPFPGGQTISVTVFLAIPKGAKNKDLAGKVLVRLLKDDMQIKIAEIGKAHPGRKGLLPPSFFDQNPWFKAFERATLTARSYAPEGVEQYGDEVIKIIAEHVEAMLFKNVPAEQTASRLQTALESFVATKQKD